MTRRLSEEQLLALQLRRDNQIGGETDGISLETAEDLGFGTTLAVLGLRQVIAEDKEVPSGGHLETGVSEIIVVDVRTIKRRPHVCAIDSTTGEIIAKIEVGERGASAEQYDRVRHLAEIKLAKQQAA